MTPAALLAECRRHGVVLTAEGDRLVYRAPRRLLTPELRAALVEHKAGLLALLQAEADPDVALVREVFGPGVWVVGAGQAAVWPPEALATVDSATEKDPLVRLAAAVGWPCVPLRPRLTILGTDWAWARFAASASRDDRASALDYLERLPVGLVPPALSGTRPAAAPPIDPFAAGMPTAQCPCCGALGWHRAGDGWTCGRCHPPPAESHAVGDTELDAALFGLAEHARFPRLALSPAVTVLAGQGPWTRFAVLTTSPSLRAAARAALVGRAACEEG
jgi:hypothetical protein